MSSLLYSLFTALNLAPHAVNAIYTSAVCVVTVASYNYVQLMNLECTQPDTHQYSTPLALCSSLAMIN